MGLLARQLRRDRALLDEVSKLDERRFDVLNGRITEEVTRLKHRLINLSTYVYSDSETPLRSESPVGDGSEGGGAANVRDAPPWVALPVADHPWVPSWTGRACEQLVLDEDGAGTNCLLPPEAHPGRPGR